MISHCIVADGTNDWQYNLQISDVTKANEGTYECKSDMMNAVQTNILTVVGKSTFLNRLLILIDAFKS